MGRASSSKKVQRAARAAGRPGTGRNWLWPAAIVVLVGLGITLVVISRGTDEASAESPTFGDHWHSAFGVYACDEFTEQVSDRNGDANGIHTHPDGLIHIHPTSANATGDNATLGVFADEVGIDLDDEGFSLTDGPSFAEGEDECDGEPGVVQLAVWDDLSDETPDIVTEEVADQRLAEGKLYTLAFAPQGADIPQPPSAANLAAPEDLAPPQGTVPGTEVPTDSTAPGDTSTTAPAADGGTSTTSTTAASGDSTTTSAP
jgi:hypothetical protein